RVCAEDDGLFAGLPTQFTVPESSARPIGIVPMSSEGCGGQSWLVGYEGPCIELAGVQAPMSLVPPWHVPLFGTPGEPPLQSGQGWMPGTPGRLSPVRKMPASRGRSMSALPVPQFMLPDAGDATLMMTHALVGVLELFGMVSGPPKKQPTSVQFRRLPVAVDVVGPTVAVCPVQLVIPTTQCRKSGVASGSVIEFCPPPT